MYNAPANASRHKLIIASHSLALAGAIVHDLKSLSLFKQ